MSDQIENKKPNNRGKVQLISYESKVLEAHADTYPEAMREPFLWLAQFICENCGRSLDVCEHKIRELGFPTTAGTLSKILRGRWRTNADNEPVTPVMALEGFINLVEALRAQPEISAMAEKVRFVETDTYLIFEDYVNERHAEDAICKFGFVIGPTGAQKTSCCKHYRRKNWRNCIWLDSAERPSLGLLIRDLCKAKNISPNVSLVRARLQFRENVTANTVIILENVQRLYTDPAMGTLAEGAQPMFSFLQKLQDETGCTIIFTATPQFYNLFINGISKGFFEQFEGRMGGRDEFLILSEYASEEDILKIAEAYELTDAAIHMEYLEGVSRLPGRIRILFFALQKAKATAVRAGQPLTIDMVKQIVPESRLKLGKKEAA